MKTRAHLFIIGKVQGVFFRSNTLAKTRETSVSGWIRNLRDGRVEAIFEGNEEAVWKMINFCKSGPPCASVKDVEIRWENYTGEYKSFTII